jgi:hypothetical protein
VATAIFEYKEGSQKCAETAKIERSKILVLILLV